MNFLSQRLEGDRKEKVTFQNFVSTLHYMLRSGITWRNAQGLAGHREWNLAENNSSALKSE